MKTAQSLVADLLKAVDTTEGDSIRVPKEDAVRIAELLVKVRFVAEAPKYKDGKMLFFCPVCEKSFSAEGREDKESSAKWHYRTWYAECPWCKREVAQSEGYWR